MIIRDRQSRWTYTAKRWTQSRISQIADYLWVCEPTQGYEALGQIFPLCSADGGGSGPAPGPTGLQLRLCTYPGVWAPTCCLIIRGLAAMVLRNLDHPFPVTAKQPRGRSL
jgi:hypothetical protein